MAKTPRITHGQAEGTLASRSLLCWVFLTALIAFAPTVTNFHARVTDLSALRVLDGDVPYRDFWTMYAPGSFVALASAYALVGRELIVSNLLGVLAAAAAIAAYFRVALYLGDRHLAGLASLVFAAAFWAPVGFTSYPPAILLILAALHSAAARCTSPGAAWSAAPGFLLGTAALFKHDVAGYATIAIAVAIVAVRRPVKAREFLPPIAVLVAAAGSVAALPLGILAAMGAAPDMWRDLFVFPLGDFRHVRAEYFPMVPRIRPTLVGTAQEIVHWGRCNLALVPMLVGLWVCWPARRRFSSAQRFILVFSVVAFGFFWSAAHVQLNTHAITLAGLGGLAGAAAAGEWTRERRPSLLLTGLGLAFLAVWMCLLTAEAGYLTVQRLRQEQAWVNLPGVRGIHVPRADAQWMRGLSAAVATAGPPEAPLLMLSNRNDIVVYADSTPYWLSGRRPVTRHHELHPGVTDTTDVQHAMLAAIGSVKPVLVREHRFTPGQLDGFKRRLHDSGVSVGSGLLDEWVEQHYQPGPRFGRYELMRRRGAESAAPN